MTGRVPMLKKSRASPDMHPFCICNKKNLALRHMNKPLFPTTLSIPSYDIGKYVIQRTYQQPNIRLKYGLSQSKILKHPYRKKKKIIFLTQIKTEHLAIYTKGISMLTHFINHGFQNFSGNELCFIIFEYVINGR
jgi:hypothetical protein